MNPLDASLEILSPIMSGSDERQQIVAAKCYGLMRGYAERWKDSPYIIDSVESVMIAPLPNLETHRNSRTFQMGGKLDVRVTDVDGAKILIDHKTTSDEIEDPGNPYWSILTIEGQVSHYMLLEWLNANKVDFGVWDVVRKPGISPKALAKKDAALFLETKVYCDTHFTDDHVSHFVDRETPMMYAARVAWDCTVDRPSRYFQRRKIPRLDQEIHEYAAELWDVAQEMIAARANHRWPRSSDSCFTYNSPCEFLGICSGHDTMESDNWRKKAWVHPELPILNNGRGTDILTNSRKRVFQACHRKAYFKYELGIEKASEEESDARYLGTLFHEALEQYFLALQQQQRGVVHG